MGTRVYQYNEVATKEIQITDAKKIIVRKLVYGAREIIDARLSVRFAGCGEQFFVTKKGLFIDKIDWIEKVLPVLNEFLGEQPL